MNGKYLRTIALLLPFVVASSLAHADQRSTQRHSVQEL
jgi:hypothetical protein